MSAQDAERTDHVDGAGETGREWPADRVTHGAPERPDPMPAPGDPTEVAAAGTSTSAPTANTATAPSTAAADTATAGTGTTTTADATARAETSTTTADAGTAGSGMSTTTADTAKGGAGTPTATDAVTAPMGAVTAEMSTVWPEAGAVAVDADGAGAMVATDRAASGDVPVGDAGPGDFPLWPSAEPAAVTTATAGRPEAPHRRPYRTPRRPAVGLPLLVVLALATAFLAWVAAEPLWLAVGHADRGRLTVTSCVGGGVNQRCTGDFTAAGNRYRARDVAVTGGADDHRAGTRVAAEMVGANGRSAYAGDRLGLTLRWAVPLGLVVVLAFLAVPAAGAGRLRGAHRAAATLLSFACPFLLSAGILAMAW